MTAHDLFATAKTLEKQIGMAPKSRRLALQPQFSKVLHELKLRGDQVPARMRDLESELTDEAIEARFDNMPV